MLFKAKYITTEPSGNSPWMISGGTRYYVDGLEPMIQNILNNDEKSILHSLGGCNFTV